MYDSPNDDGFISGIHNYCDRGCERCEFTNRCSVYAEERAYLEGGGSFEVDDVVENLTTIFAETKQILIEKAKDLGIDPFSISDEEFAEIRKRETEFVDGDELAKLGERYWRSAKEILDDISLYNHESLADSLSVLCHYLFFIPVEIKSSLHGLLDEDGFEDQIQLEDPQSCANGKAKVGLIAIDRSLLAWDQLVESGRTNRAYAMVELLEAIRLKFEKRFPLARDFLRPGFDEIEIVM